MYLKSNTQNKAKKHKVPVLFFVLLVLTTVIGHALMIDFEQNASPDYAILKSSVESFSTLF